MCQYLYISLSYKNNYNIKLFLPFKGEFMKIILFVPVYYMA